MNQKQIAISFIIIYVADYLFRSFNIVSFFIFPAFIIVLALREDVEKLLLFTVIISMLFDLSSGITFGFMTVIMLIVYGTIALARKKITIDRDSIVHIVLFTVIFMIEYLALFKLAMKYF
ncbi:MAG: hypothetical protein ABH833_01850 [Parcubacteria group bacterium]